MLKMQRNSVERGNVAPGFKSTSLSSMPSNDKGGKLIFHILLSSGITVALVSQVALW